MDNDDYNYEPFYHPRPAGCTTDPVGVWMILVTPRNSDEPFFMTCGAKSETDVMRRIRDLILDDDAIDTRNGRPRKFQS